MLSPRQPWSASGQPLASGRDMQALLDAWVDRGWLRGVDATLAHFIAREAPDATPLLLLGVALTSHQLGRGHACLDLQATLQDPWQALSLPPDDDPADAAPLPDPATLLAGIGLEQWCQQLAHAQVLGSGPGHSPLVLDGARLYLRRYWQYEQSVRQGIAQRLQAGQAGQAGPTPAPDALRPALDALFPPAADAGAAPGPDWQKIACALAARQAFCIITGGPGTGKTTTVVRLLALLQSQALAGANGTARPLRIRLAAPTGKAAARLGDAIASAVAHLPLQGLSQAQALRAHIPTRVSTLHRLLGSLPESRHFRHHAGHPLPLDLLVIDEASMVDLEMMHAVLDALPPGARLVLLGDKDQLASVEAGAVLGSLCRRATAGHFTPATAQWIAAASGEAVPAELLDDTGHPLDQAVVMLRHSRRFAAGSGIGRLADAVNHGDTTGTQAVLAEQRPDCRLLPLRGDGGEGLRALVLDGHPGGDAVPARQGLRHYLSLMHSGQPAPGASAEAMDAWALAVLQAQSRFQLLCALRRGPWGVEGLNLRIASWLHAEGLITQANGWYPGRPVLVTRNDHALGLMNGDVGVTLARPRVDGSGSDLRVAFPLAGETGSAPVRWVLPSRLQQVETVYALTVHKSQGSEFDHTALVLPDRANPILTRELVYTGITRARQWLTLVLPGSPDLLRQAVQRRILRSSGLD